MYCVYVLRIDTYGLYHHINNINIPCLGGNTSNESDSKVSNILSVLKPPNPRKYQVRSLLMHGGTTVHTTPSLDPPILIR